MKTGRTLAVPLTWVHSIVAVQHDHVPVFAPHETPEETRHRVMSPAARGPRPRGCGPWAPNGDFACDESHNVYRILCYCNGRLSRLHTWHNFTYRGC